MHAHTCTRAHTHTHTHTHTGPDEETAAATSRVAEHLGDCWVLCFHLPSLHPRDNWSGCESATTEGTDSGAYYTGVNTIKLFKLVQI